MRNATYFVICTCILLTAKKHMTIKNTKNVFKDIRNIKTFLTSMVLEIRVTQNNNSTTT